MSAAFIDYGEPRRSDVRRIAECGLRNQGEEYKREHRTSKLYISDAEREVISSTLRWTASRTAAGRESNALENVGDQIWSAAPTNYFGWRAVY